MATVILVLTKPLNVSLQAKTSNVSSTTASIDSGAWDIIYFVRMENGKQIGDVYRLGKCIGIQTTPNKTIVELVTNGTFDTDISGWTVKPGAEAFTNAYNTGGGEMQIVAGPGDHGVMVQEITGLTIGESYTFSYECVSGSKNFAHLYDTGLIQSNIGLNTLGVHIHTFTATTTSVSIHLGVIDGLTANFDNVSVQNLVVVTSDQYLVDVEVDSTAQTPVNGDYIFFGKENKVCISGVKGYFAEVEMKNDSTEKAELFSVGSEMTLSSK